MTLSLFTGIRSPFRRRASWRRETAAVRGAASGPARASGASWLVPLSVTVAGLALYVPRAFSTLAVYGDSPEVVTAARVWGVPHAPGYPLLTALAHVVLKSVPGDPAAVVNRMSAVFHAVAAGLVASTTLSLTGSVSAAVLGAIALLLSRSFFLGALYAEVFPLSDLFLAALLAAACRFARRRRATLVGVLALLGLFGFGCAHHPMLLLSAPALAMLSSPAVGPLRRSPCFLVLAPLAATLPWVLSYALVPLAAARDPWVSWGDVRSLGDLVALVTRYDYGGVLRPSRGPVEGQLLERLDAFVSLVARDFGPVLVLALFGAGTRSVALRSRAALVTAFLATGPAFAALNAIDLHSEYRLAYFERFTTLSHVPLAVLVGAGAAAALAGRGGPLRLATRAALGLSLLPLLGRPRALDFHADRSGLAYARDLILGTPDGSLILLAGDMPAHAAMYACGVEDRCGRRVVLSPGQLRMPWSARQLARRHPELGLSPAALAGLSLSELIAQGVRAGPVYVHPELVRKAPDSFRDFWLVPELLLERVYGSGAALESDSEARKMRFERVASGGFEGAHALPTRAPSPTMQAQLLSAYTEGLARQAAAARELGWADLGARLAASARDRTSSSTGR